MCAKASAERRNEELGEMGDEWTDEVDYGVDSKAFPSVVDFGRRFTSLLR